MSYYCVLLIAFQCFYCIFTCATQILDIYYNFRFKNDLFSKRLNVINKNCEFGHFLAVAKILFFYVSPPKEDIFLTTFYGLYFITMGTYIFTDYISICGHPRAAFMYCFKFLCPLTCYGHSFLL